MTQKIYLKLQYSRKLCSDIHTNLGIFFITVESCNLFFWSLIRFSRNTSNAREADNASSKLTLQVETHL